VNSSRRPKVGATDALSRPLHWQTDRMVRLNEIEAQCVATAALAPPNPNLADENLRGYVMLLSAHFQGFCRDLHTKCIHLVAATLAPSLQVMFQSQCYAGRLLDSANPRYASIRKDFERFNLDLATAIATDPANQLRTTHLDHLILWRNYAAYHQTSMPVHGGPFVIPTVQAWRVSCDGLATELDRVMYNQLQTLTGAAPW
jgi:hypothetical protein